MLTNAFCNLALRQFVTTQPSWAQLHTSDPGSDGLNGGAIDVRRMQITWGPVTGVTVASTNTLTWDNVKGIPSFPQDIKFLTLWSAAEGGICWASSPILPIRVPNGATLEIPPGIALHLATLTDD